MLTNEGKHKLRISFEGIESSALRGIREMEELAKQHEDYDEYSNAAFSARACISAYLDTILALCKGAADVEAVTDFWFHGQDVKTVPYRNEVIRFEESEGGC